MKTSYPPSLSLQKKVSLKSHSTLRAVVSFRESTEFLNKIIWNIEVTNSIPTHFIYKQKRRKTRPFQGYVALSKFKNSNNKLNNLL